MINTCMLHTPLAYWKEYFVQESGLQMNQEYASFFLKVTSKEEVHEYQQESRKW